MKLSIGAMRPIIIELFGQRFGGEKDLCEYDVYLRIKTCLFCRYAFVITDMKEALAKDGGKRGITQFHVPAIVQPWD